MIKPDDGNSFRRSSAEAAVIGLWVYLQQEYQSGTSSSAGDFVQPHMLW
jgi:hypothetical protein